MTEAKKAEADPLRAGVSRRVVDVDPSMRGPGMRLWCDPFVAVETDLTVTALVLSWSGRTVVILGCDLLLVGFDTAGEVRRRVAEAVGTPTSHVLLNCSHTHSAPGTSEWRTADDDEQRAMELRFEARITRAAVDAAVEASRSLRPARSSSTRSS